MTFSRSDVLSTAQRSLATAGAQDRDGWIGLFTADATIEDPVGSRPHRGSAAIRRFYDTFIGPRTITFRVHSDVVVDTTVVRDVDLVIAMSAQVTLTVPTFIRYDLRDDRGALRVSALSAYWELPAMVTQFARGGLAAAPSGITLGRTMLAQQGPAGCAGFLRGFRGTGSRIKSRFVDLLDTACNGDELGLRRHLGAASVTLGERTAIAPAEVLKQLHGGRRTKTVRSGTAVAARIERGDQRWILVADTDSGTDRNTFSRLRLFGEMAS